MQSPLWNLAIPLKQAPYKIGFQNVTLIGQNFKFRPHPKENIINWGVILNRFSLKHVLLLFS